jgi:hypothetical protein
MSYCSPEEQFAPIIDEYLLCDLRTVDIFLCGMDDNSAVDARYRLDSGKCHPCVRGDLAHFSSSDLREILSISPSLMAQNLEIP